MACLAELRLRSHDAATERQRSVPPWREKRIGDASYFAGALKNGTAGRRGNTGAMAEWTAGRRKNRSYSPPGSAL